jgi:hypothetical protein
MFKLILAFLFGSLTARAQEKIYVFSNRNQDTATIEYSIKGDTSIFKLELHCKPSTQNQTIWKKTFKIMKSGKSEMVYIEDTDQGVKKYIARKPSYFGFDNTANKKLSAFSKKVVYQQMIELQSAFIDLGETKKGCLKVRNIKKVFYHDSNIRIGFNLSFGPMTLEIVFDDNLMLKNNERFQLVTVDGRAANDYIKYFCAHLKQRSIL